MQKGFGIIYILIGILVLGLVAGGAYYLGKSTSPQPTPQPFYPPPSSTPSLPPLDKNLPILNKTSDQTANWKTYTNQKFHYSLEYPSTWYIGEQSDITYISPESVPTIPLTHGLPSAMQIFAKEGLLEDQIVPSWKHTIKNTVIDGVTGQSLIDLEPSKFDGVMRTSITIKNDSFVYSIIFSNTDKDGSHNSVFDQILSTLKFTSP